MRIAMTANLHHALNITRRHFLGNYQIGLGGLALSLLMGRKESAAAEPITNPMAARQPHFTPKVKNVIYLHMAGSPPHLDLFDYKPALVQRNGQDCPQEFLRGRRFAFTSGTPKLLGTPQPYRQHGRSGAWVSAALPQIATVVDEVTFIKSMFTDQFNHAPAELLLFTGSPQFGR